MSQWSAGFFFLACVLGMAPLNARALVHSCAHSDSNLGRDSLVALTFEVHAPGLNADSTVCLAGSPTQWGGWNPSGFALKYQGQSIWTGTTWLSKQSLEYKFTLGSWDYEALDHRGLKRPNAVLDLRHDTTVVDTIQGWSDQQTSHPVVGQLTGNVVSLGMLQPPELLAREAWIWFPTEMDSAVSIERILIMHDGQNVMDPVKANFSVDWGVDECLDSLILRGQIPPTLLVAVACTSERSEDYGPGFQGERYVDWLVASLLPQVRELGNVREDVPVTVAGASMGGLISFIAAMRHPQAISSAICMSPAFGYAGFQFADTLRSVGWEGSHVPIWLDNGTVGLEEQLQPGIDNVVGVLEEVNQTFSMKVYQGARHFESDWGARFQEALMFCIQHEVP